VCELSTEKRCSTVQVAKLLKISSNTLHRWIREKKIAAPEAQFLGGMQVRLWTEDDVAKLRQFKESRFWGRGGRQKKRKKK
jgi:excisionase family DNA binding protein